MKENKPNLSDLSLQIGNYIKTGDSKNIYKSELPFNDLKINPSISPKEKRLDNIINVFKCDTPLLFFNSKVKTVRNVILADCDFSSLGRENMNLFNFLVLSTSSGQTNNVAYRRIKRMFNPKDIKAIGTGICFRNSIIDGNYGAQFFKVDLKGSSFWGSKVKSKLLFQDTSLDGISLEELLMEDKGELRIEFSDKDSNKRGEVKNASFSFSHNSKRNSLLFKNAILIDSIFGNETKSSKLYFEPECDFQIRTSILRNLVVVFSYPSTNKQIFEKSVFKEVIFKGNKLEFSMTNCEGDISLEDSENSSFLFEGLTQPFLEIKNSKNIAIIQKSAIPTKLDIINSTIGPKIDMRGETDLEIQIDEGSTLSLSEGDSTLSRRTISNLKLSRKQLTLSETAKLDFSFSKFVHCEFKKIDLSCRIDFFGAHFVNSSLVEASFGSLKNVSFIDCNLSNTSFDVLESCTISGEKIILKDVIFKQNLVTLTVENIKADQVPFFFKALKNINLLDTLISNFKVDFIELEGTTFDSVTFEGLRLQGIKALHNDVKFIGQSKFRNINFTDAKIEGVKFADRFAISDSCILVNLHFINCEFSSTQIWSKAETRNLKFIGCKFLDGAINSNFDWNCGAELYNCQVENCHISIEAQGLTLKNIKFIDCEIEKIQVSSSSIEEVSIVNSKNVKTIYFDSIENLDFSLDGNCVVDSIVIKNCQEPNLKLNGNSFRIIEINTVDRGIVSINEIGKEVKIEMLKMHSSKDIKLVILNTCIKRLDMLNTQFNTNSMFKQVVSKQAIINKSNLLDIDAPNLANSIIDGSEIRGIKLRGNLTKHSNSGFSFKYSSFINSDLVSYSDSSDDSYYEWENVDFTGCSFDAKTKFSLNGGEENVLERKMTKFVDCKFECEMSNLHYNGCDFSGAVFNAELGKKGSSKRILNSQFVDCKFSEASDIGACTFYSKDKSLVFSLKGNNKLELPVKRDICFENIELRDVNIKCSQTLIEIEIDNCQFSGSSLIYGTLKEAIIKESSIHELCIASESVQRIKVFHSQMQYFVLRDGGREAKVNISYSPNIRKLVFDQWKFGGDTEISFSQICSLEILASSNLFNEVAKPELVIKLCYFETRNSIKLDDGSQQNLECSNGDENINNKLLLHFIKPYGLSQEFPEIIAETKMFKLSDPRYWLSEPEKTSWEEKVRALLQDDKSFDKLRRIALKYSEIRHNLTDPKTLEEDKKILQYVKMLPGILEETSFRKYKVLFDKLNSYIELLLSESNESESESKANKKNLVNNVLQIIELRFSGKMKEPLYIGDFLKRISEKKELEFCLENETQSKACKTYIDVSWFADEILSRKIFDNIIRHTDNKKVFFSWFLDEQKKNMNLCIRDEGKGFAVDVSRVSNILNSKPFDTLRAFVYKYCEFLELATLDDNGRMNSFCIKTDRRTGSDKFVSTDKPKIRHSIGTVYLFSFPIS